MAVGEAHFPIKATSDPVYATLSTNDPVEIFDSSSKNIAKTFVAWGQNENSTVLCNLADLKSKGDIACRREEGGSCCYRSIGRCVVEIEDYLLEATNTKMTGNVCVVKMWPGMQVENKLSCLSSNGQMNQHQLNLHVGEVATGTRVMLIDHLGISNYGLVTSIFNGHVPNSDESLFGVLCVESLLRPGNAFITDPQNFGRVVMSIPDPGSDQLEVYGMTMRSGFDSAGQVTAVVPLYPIARKLSKLSFSSVDSGYSSNWSGGEID